MKIFFGPAVLFIIFGCRGVETVSAHGTPENTPVVTEGRPDSLAKPSSPISIRYEILSKPVLGQPLEIRVTTFSKSPLASMTVQIHGDEKLFISPLRMDSAVSGLEGQQSLEGRQSIVRTVTVTPYAEGLLRFSVLVQGQINGQLQAGHVTIPLQVGEDRGELTPARTIGTIGQDVSGQAIISLPAREN